MAKDLSKEAAKLETRFRALMKAKTENPKQWALKRGANEHALRSVRAQLTEIPQTIKARESAKNKEVLKLAENVEYDRDRITPFALANRSLLTTGAVPTMAEAQAISAQKGIDKRYSRNLSQFNKIDFSDGKAQFKNDGSQFAVRTPDNRTIFNDPKQQAEYQAGLDSLKIPTAEAADTNKLQTMEVPATTGSSYLKEWTTDMPLDAESVKIKGSELTNRNLLRPRTDQDFRNLSGPDIQRLEQSGGMQYKRGGLAHKLKIAKIRHMSEMAGDG